MSSVDGVGLAGLGQLGLVGPSLEAGQDGRNSVPTVDCVPGNGCADCWRGGVLLAAPNNQLRTGMDKGNPTV